VHKGVLFAAYMMSHLRISSSHEASHGTWRCLALLAFPPETRRSIPSSRQQHSLGHRRSIQPAKLGTAGISAHSRYREDTERAAPWTPLIKMTMVEEYDESANVDDGGMTGPGAPTPLSALEV